MCGAQRHVPQALDPAGHLSPTRADQHQIGSSLGAFPPVEPPSRTREAPTAAFCPMPSVGRNTKRLSVERAGADTRRPTLDRFAPRILLPKGCFGRYCMALKTPFILRMRGPDFVPTFFVAKSREKGRSVDSGVPRNRQFRCHFAAPHGVGPQAVSPFCHTGEALVSVANSTSALILLCHWAETAPIYGGSVRHSVGFHRVCSDRHRCA